MCFGLLRQSRCLWDCRQHLKYRVGPAPRSRQELGPNCSQRVFVNRLDYMDLFHAHPCMTAGTHTHTHTHTHTDGPETRRKVHNRSCVKARGMLLHQIVLYNEILIKPQWWQTETCSLADKSDCCLMSLDGFLGWVFKLAGPYWWVLLLTKARVSTQRAGFTECVLGDLGQCCTWIRMRQHEAFSHFLGFLASSVATSYQAAAGHSMMFPLCNWSVG